MFLLDDLLLAPIKGVVWLGTKIQEILEREQADEGRLKERLLELQYKLESKDIDEEEYAKEEKEILELLNARHQAKEEK